jgi:hypothetical protein
MGDGERGWAVWVARGGDRLGVHGRPRAEVARVASDVGTWRGACGVQRRARGLAVRIMSFYVTWFYFSLLTVSDFVTSTAQ